MYIYLYKRCTDQSPGHRSSYGLPDLIFIHAHDPTHAITLIHAQDVVVERLDHSFKGLARCIDVKFLSFVLAEEGCSYAVEGPCVYVCVCM